jgi:N-acyl homoserine lactone hydrolase
MGKGFSIYPLDLGTLVGIDKSVFTFARNQGLKIDVPCLAWLILGGDRKILVDTGPCDPDWASRYHRPLRKAPHQEIGAALNKFGLSPEQIDLVIFTHLHWDHCFNLESLSSAHFLVQKSEVQYAVAPLPSDRVPYEVGIPGIQPPWMKVFGRMTLLEGDEEVLPGISVMHLPGHTPGSQVVVVETTERPWVIAGDAVPLYENWRGDKALSHIPSGIYQNLYDAFKFLGRLDSFGDRILPGHDESVLAHEKYPVNATHS